MISLYDFAVKRIEEKDDYGVFEIGPLLKGYSYTISNSLRRILLSSIEGAAVTSVKINGVKHEFSTMEGLQEDVISILLKLKTLAIRINSGESAVLGLSIKGKKGSVLTITAKDFEIPNNIEILNADLEVATLTSDVDLVMEITVEKGTGYAYQDEGKRGELGTIPLDAIYSPVKRVKVTIGKTRVGQDTDLDMVRLEVYKNKTVKPTEAMLRAAEIYDSIANRLVDLLGGDSAKLEMEQESANVVAQEKEVRIPISELGLTTRLNNALLNAGIANLADLNKFSRDEVTNFRGMGKKSMTELIDIMEQNDVIFDK